MELHGYFTTQGLELAAKLSIGAGLEITRVLAGAGKTGLSAAALAKSRQALSAGAPRRSGNTAVIPVTLAAAQASAEYALTELGVYARDPDKGEILYKIYRLEESVKVSPASRLTLRFYLEETVSQDVSAAVSCSPAGLVTETDLAPVWDKANGVKGSEEIYEVEASKLQACINALPRCLTRNVTIKITGTAEKRITVQDFYGNGRLSLHKGTEERYCLAQGIAVKNCRCFIVVSEAEIRSGGSTEIVSFTRCTEGELFDVDIRGSAETSVGVSVSFSDVRLASAGVSNCRKVLIAANGSRVNIHRGEYVEAPVYGGNQLGAQIYRGGFVFLDQGVPELLGAAAHSGGGGLIIKSDGTLL